ncbi:hypothetical protein ACFZB5_13720 [Streptomyces nodosus]|uniref:hypothetical protein n=1 Tax=Streptomyces nodosus TaxID=40318 RepID=UPI0036E258FF
MTDQAPEQPAEAEQLRQTAATLQAIANRLREAVNTDLPAEADDRDPRRAARRASLRNLLARLDRVPMIAAEKTLLRQQVEAELGEGDRARYALRRLMRHLRNHDEPEEQHIDRIPPAAVRQLVDAVADALPDWDPAMERDVVWAHYQLTHRVLTCRLEHAEAERDELREEITTAESKLANMAKSRNDWQWSAEDAQRTTRVQRERAEQAEAAIERVRAAADKLADGTEAGFRAALAIRESLDEPKEQPPAQHLGNKANAEDCPACTGTNPPYPFICPGPEKS